jgi:ATP-dependent Lon protease
VLDPEQNNMFSDHYLDVPYNLSKVMFIMTANMLDPIPPALLDRMEVIELPGYIEDEKFHIAKQFLMPRQIEEHGLTPSHIRFTDAALKRIIREYTHEAGVRNLEREIGTICRKIAKRVAEAMPPDAPEERPTEAQAAQPPMGDGELATEPLDSKLLEEEAVRATVVASEAASEEGEVSDMAPAIEEASGKRRMRAVVIREEDLEKYLRPPRYSFGLAEEQDEVGVATGVYWTPMGGDTIAVEVSLMDGKGGMLLTGQLGDVMKESAQAALSYARARAKQLGIDPGRFEKTDIHVHVPAGAQPKDGPSAGVTMATALVSAFTGRKVRREVAMTGEITLRGKVLPIGGLKEKVLAAHRAGIETFVLPRKNEKDLDEIPQKVRRELELVVVDDLDTVLRTALKPAAGASETVDSGPAPKPEKDTKKAKPKAPTHRHERTIPSVPLSS